MKVYFSIKFPFTKKRFNRFSKEDEKAFIGFIGFIGFIKFKKVLLQGHINIYYVIQHLPI